MAVTKEGMAYRIAAGYKTTGEAVGLGSVVIDGKPYPQCRVRVSLQTLCKHGILLGSTGGGKTKSLQILAEQLSSAGVPVVMADVKGDLQGLARPGFRLPQIVDRVHDSGCDDWFPQGFPVEFAGLGSEHGFVPVRASVKSFGPMLLSKVLGLSDTQESVLDTVFMDAEDAGMPLDTLADLREAITEVARQGGDEIGYISKASAGVIVREIRRLEHRAGTFFGAPSFDPLDLMRVVDDGVDRRGVITLFEMADRLDQQAIFPVFLMWMLGELYRTLPEVGVVDRPKLVLVFDEAHLLFSNASKAFIDTMISTVRLIRSKGVGLFFCTQSAKDIHPDVMSQLGLRVLHGLRANTPEMHRALKQTALTFPTTDAYDLAATIPNLRVGEALVTVLPEEGGVSPVAQTWMQPPRSFMGTIGPNDIRDVVRGSELFAKYFIPEPDPEEVDDAAPVDERPDVTGMFTRAATASTAETKFDQLMKLVGSKPEEPERI
jgi:hypothetical protein